MQIYRLKQLFAYQLLLKDIYIIFHSYMFQFVSMEPSSNWAFKKVLYTIDNVFVRYEISYYFFFESTKI
jgi:hypothetical protein